MVRFLKIVSLVLVAFVAAGLIAYRFVCPCSIIPGGELSGAVELESVSDWSFANEVPLCQLEVNPQRPHSINLNCMSDQGRLFVSCSQCASKRWAATALEIPEGRIRIQDTVYPVSMRRLESDADLDLSWRARSIKLGKEPDVPRPDHWWSFEMHSR